MSSNSSFCCYQGYLDQAGTLEQNIKALSAYDCISVSHVKTRNMPNGCLDVGYPDMAGLISGIRTANPQTLIYGYVPATADAPPGSECGMNPNYAQHPWSAPTCANFISWVDDWKALGVDGINIDVCASQFINAVIRDNVFSYVKLCGMSIMANSTTPSADNVRFVCESQHFGSGDSVMIEGYIVQEGIDTLHDTNAAIAALRGFKGINLVALATEAWGEPKPSGSINDSNARSFFENFYQPGDVYQYTSADLGVVTHRI